MGAFFFGKAIKNSGIKILWKKGLTNDINKMEKQKI